ncbi:glycerol-3-phosphate acyltransferase [Candidatus Cytomitobacter indipagum]|uniref:Glycerol-3-phosphate acyltransferase n=1 Tax=Candidatus Cytomitobacter indipagum TaxID=2601575 RepID=A0A5C0UD75_9PROT|nr:glycerol-3-phosphate acyltransferase [Candidatus Cytomitobacter indipagum]QEK37986.1 glycerol-3-phosphate acyltransferase [Candidatus Cytomitobacter indipagum]
MHDFILLTSSFLVGSIPFGRIWSFLLGKKDLRNCGSGNIGTTNAFRVNGKVVGILTALFDVGKGFACLLFPNPALFGSWIVIGHIYAPWSGGKGVAAFFGICLAILKFYALIPMITWIALVYCKIRPTYASYVALFIMCIIAFIKVQEIFMLIALLSVAIIYKHIVSDLSKRCR